MPVGSSNLRTAKLPSAMLALLAATAAAWWTLAGDRLAPVEPAGDGITVVKGSVPAASKLQGPTPSSPLPRRSSDVTVARITRAYPLLSAASLHCEATGCTLTGTIRPPNGQGDLDSRQEMLLGGLAAELADDGYELVVPFDMTEVDDNLFRLRAAVIDRRSRTG